MQVAEEKSQLVQAQPDVSVMNSFESKVMFIIDLVGSRQQPAHGLGRRCVTV